MVDVTTANRRRHSARMKGRVGIANILCNGSRSFLTPLIAAVTRQMTVTLGGRRKILLAGARSFSASKLYHRRIGTSKRH